MLCTVLRCCFSEKCTSSYFFFSCASSPDTAATLEQIKALPRGIHNVPVDIKDLQGFGEEQTVKVRICQCRNGVCLAKETSVSLGALALLAMLLPLVLLLLLCESPPTDILMPAELCRLHCADDETRILCSCMCKSARGVIESFRFCH